MRILLAGLHTSQSCRPIGGVQSWIDTVATVLRARGHDAVTWCPEFPLPQGDEFDLGILSNIGATIDTIDLCDRFINVSHGIIKAERPSQYARVVFTSEGGMEHWKNVHSQKLPFVVIGQPIDGTFWRPVGERRPLLVRYSYRDGLPWLDDVARSLGMDYVHAKNLPHEDARILLGEAACVLATGRAALEAAACGAPVVICDDREYQGPLCAPFGHRQRAQNYSGRGGEKPAPDLIRAMIQTAMAQHGWREYVLFHHDAEMIVDELLHFAETT